MKENEESSLIFPTSASAGTLINFFAQCDRQLGSSAEVYGDFRSHSAKAQNSAFAKVRETNDINFITLEFSTNDRIRRKPNLAVGPDFLFSIP
jgi:hypothetical protein